MMRKWLCQADVVLHLSPIDPVLVKSGYAPVEGPDMAPVRMQHEGPNGSDQTFYLPGTSLKGVLRSHLERIARTLVEGSVCIPYYDRQRAADYSIPVESERESYGCGFLLKTTKSKSEVYRLCCPVCRMFGSLQFAGRLNISDAYPLSGDAPRPEPRNGVGIDRFTGGSAHGVLFDQEVLVGGRFEAHLRLVNFELWQLGMLLVLLADLADDMLQVGSGRSRGLGRVHGEIAEAKLSYARRAGADGAPASLAGISELDTSEARDTYGFYQWEAPADRLTLPASAERGLRTQYDVTDLWRQWHSELLGSVEAVLQWYKDHVRPDTLAAWSEGN